MSFHFDADALNFKHELSEDEIKSLRRKYDKSSTDNKIKSTSGEFVTIDYSENFEPEIELFVEHSFYEQTIYLSDTHDIYDIEDSTTTKHESFDTDGKRSLIA